MLLYLGIESVLRMGVPGEGPFLVQLYASLQVTFVLARLDPRWSGDVYTSNQPIHLPLGDRTDPASTPSVVFWRFFVSFSTGAFSGITSRVGRHLRFAVLQRPGAH